MITNLDDVGVFLLQHKLFKIKSCFVFLAPSEIQKKRRVVIMKPSKCFYQT